MAKTSEMASAGAPTGREAAGRQIGDRLAACCSAAAIGGTLLCSLSMTAAAVGVFAAGGAAAAKDTGSMSGMGGPSSSGSASPSPAWLDFLIRFGPEILIVSILLLTFAVGLRRRDAIVPALSGGLILYVGMYAQPSLPVMYAAMAIGTAFLLLAFVASLRPTLGFRALRPSR